LKKKGKLVSPYFRPTLGLNPALDTSSDIFSLTSFMTGNNTIASLFKSQKAEWLDDNWTRSYEKKFLDLVQKYNNKEDIDEEVKKLVQNKFSERSKAYQNYIENLANYAISKFDLDVFNQVLKDAQNGKNSYRPKFFKHDKTQEASAITSLEKKYYNDLGFDAKFLTNLTYAKELGAELIEAQEWKKGDYPYGQSNNIALVINQ
jgi:hypothetical protein